MRLLRRLLGGARGRPIDALSHGSWIATHRHRKGGLYRRVTTATLETDRSPVVIYDDAEGNLWVRPVAEFEDGRFTKV